MNSEQRELTKLAKALRRSGHNRQADTVLKLAIGPGEGMQSWQESMTEGAVAGGAIGAGVSWYLGPGALLGLGIGGTIGAGLGLYRYYTNRDEYATAMKALGECAKPVLAGFDTLGSFWNADVNQNTVLTALKDNDLDSLYGELIRVLMDQDFYGDWIAMGLGDDAGQMQQLTTLPNALLRYKEKPLGISGLLKEISSDPNYTAWGGRATFDYIKSRDLQNYADTWDRLTSLHHCIKQTKPDPTPGPTPPPTPGTEWNCTNEEGGIVSMSAKLTSEALGNEFRAWVLKDPARAEALKDIYTRLGYSSTVLSPTGDHTNKWIGQAWKKYGCEYSKEEKEPRLPDDDTDTEPVTEGEVVCTTGDIVDETDLSDVVRSPVSGGKIGLYNGEAYFQLEKGSFSEGKDVSGKYVSLKCRDNITDGRYPNFLNHKEQRALVKTQKGPGKGQDRRRIRRQVRQDRRARRRKRRT